MSTQNNCIDLSCFDDIIGLSEIECECFTQNDYNISKSCLFLDRAEGMQLRQIDALKDCSNDGDLWLLMDSARTKAIQRFVSDTQARMGEKYELSRSLFSGYIGKNQANQLRNISTTYAGVRWRTAQIVGGFAKIKAINTIFQATGNVMLDIYNSLNEHLYSMSLDTEAGKMHRNILSTPIVLPLWDGRTDALDYVFIYTYDPANKPYDNNLSCCGRSYKFNCKNPYWKNKSNKLEGWSEWMMVGEIETTSLDFSCLECTCGDYMNGLQFETDIYCDTTKQFCFDTPNIQDVQFMSVAFAILHAAAQYLCIDLITSDKLNYYTLIDREQLEAVRQLHENKYLELLTKIIDNADLKNTDCFKCRDRYGMRRGIL